MGTPAAGLRKFGNVRRPSLPPKRPQLAPLGAIFGAKDYVDVISGECVDQRVAPSATQNARSAFWR